jgi:hypothetical protein
MLKSGDFVISSSKMLGGMSKKNGGNVWNGLERKARGLNGVWVREGGEGP